MGSRSQRECWGALGPMVLAGNMHKNTMQFTSSGASCYFLCRQCPPTAEVQVHKCSSCDKHTILATCFFLTRCGLAVVNVPLIFPSCFHSPSLFSPCFVSLQPPPWACPYLSPVCWAALLLATKPCCTSLLHPAEDKSLSLAASPGYSIRAMGGTAEEGSPD